MKNQQTDFLLIQSYKFLVLPVRNWTHYRYIECICICICTVARFNYSPCEGNSERRFWLAFKDLFEPMVHNRTDLDPAYKLAAPVCRSRECSDDWRIIYWWLPRGVIWAKVTLWQSTPIVRNTCPEPNNPAETPNTLRSIVNCVRNSLCTYRPKTSRSELGMSLTTVSIPKLEDLLLFQERRANNISTASYSYSAREWTQFINAPSINVACPHCLGNHRLIKCFQNMQVQER